MTAAASAASSSRAATRSTCASSLAAIAQDGGADLRAAAERAARSLSRSVVRRLGELPADAQALARALAVLDGDVPLHLAGALAELEPAAALAAADELARADMTGARRPLRLRPSAAAVGGLRRALADRARGAPPRRGAAGRAGSLERAGRRAPARGLRRRRRGGVAGLRAAAADGARPRRAGRRRRLPRARAARAVGAARPGPSCSRSSGGPSSRRAAARPSRTSRPRSPSPAIRRRRAELGLDLGRTLHDFGRVAEACDAFEPRDRRARGRRPRRRPPGLVPHLRDDRARAGGRRPRADRLDPRARGRRRYARRAHAASKVLIMRVYAGGERSELVPLARRIFAGGRLIDEGGLLTQAAGHVAAAFSYCDEYAAAEDVLARSLAEARRTGLVVWVAAAFQLRSRQRLWTGPLPDAVEDARGAFEIFAGGRHMYLPATVYCLARGLTEQDEPDEAAAVLASLDGSERGGFAAWAAEARGRLAAHRGDHEGALAAFVAVGDTLRDLGLTNPAMFHWRSEAALAALRLEQTELAAELVAEELDLAERFGAPRAIGVARRAAGLLERGEQAVETLRAAAELHERCGARLEQALSLVELGAAVRRAGRPTEARTALREGIRLAGALGATALERRARDELDRAGARRDGSGELTPSERRVAELAAAGRTNREIAAELFVTVKAVEWHLGNVYRKLDIRGRRQLEQIP